MIAEIDKAYPGLDEVRRGAELVRELISCLIGAVVSEAGRRLQAANPQSVEDVRNHGEVLIAFPPDVARAEAEIKAFLKLRMYRHSRVMRVMGRPSRSCSTCLRAIRARRPICRPNGCRRQVRATSLRPAARGGSATLSPG